MISFRKINFFFPEQGEFLYFPSRRSNFSLNYMNLYIFQVENQIFPPTKKMIDKSDTNTIVQECILREKNMILQLENHIFFPKPGERHTSYIPTFYNLPPIIIYFSLVIQIFSQAQKRYTVLNTISPNGNQYDFTIGKSYFFL